LIKFSVITVVRNDLQGLKKSRESLEAQKFKNWRHIIIDGGSTDGIPAFLNLLPKSNTTFISEPDSGIYNAMNKGWKIAEPDSYVYFLNARDTFATEEALIHADASLKADPKSNWGCTTHEEIQENGEGWVCKLVSPPSIANQLYAFGYRSHQAVIMKGSFIRLLGGFNEQYKLAADWDLIVRALLIQHPTIWEQTLGRFELGGISSQRLLESHRELNSLRKIYLPSSIKTKFFDQVWCALYLGNLGYVNYLTPIINILYPTTKKNRKYKKRLSLKFVYSIRFHKGKFPRFHSNKFPILGKLLYIFFYVLGKLLYILEKLLYFFYYSPLSYFSKILGNFRSLQMKILHKTLKIIPYGKNSI
jgi:glycosyltransferase involved in cell wall biosynthesis